MTWGIPFALYVERRTAMLNQVAHLVLVAYVDLRLPPTWLLAICAGNSPVTGDVFSGSVTRKMFPFDDVIVYGRKLAESEAYNHEHYLQSGPVHARCSCLWVMSSSTISTKQSKDECISAYYYDLKLLPSTHNQTTRSYTARSRIFFYFNLSYRLCYE